MSKMRGQKTKKQHYVPRCYLKRFLNSEENVYVFDKFAQRSYPASLFNIAHENGFYDLPAQLVARFPPESGVNAQAIETWLSGIETRYDRILSRFVRDIDSGTPLPQVHQFDLALCLVIQYLRTKEHRQSMKQLSMQMHQAIAAQFLRRQLPDAADHVEIQVTCPEEHWTVEQARSLLDEEHRIELASYLIPHIWIIGVNRTIQPFYTSDNPVVKRPNCFAPGRSFTGLRSPGIEIHFPVSPRHVVILLERAHFKSQARLHGRVIELSPFDVERINSLQAKRSYRQIYCSEAKFEQAVGVCRRYPEICSPDRERGRVDVRGDTLAFLGMD